MPRKHAYPGRRPTTATLVNYDWLGKKVAAQALLAAMLVFMAPQAWAMPQGGTVVSGSATISQAGNQLKVVQTTPKVAINWQSYGIGANELVSYYQPSAQAIALNRVLGGGSSVINGRLNANGQVWISNPRGILFGPSARVNVGGLIATTHDIKVEDFNADRYRFKSDVQPPGIVENQGWITVAEAGLTAFVAPGVVNHGVINARLGQVFLASGNEFTVDLYGDQKINLALDEMTAQQVMGRDGKPLDALVKTDGKIFADGGMVQITATVAKGLVDNVISIGGLIEAHSVRQVNGEIILGGNGGGVQVTGTLDASGKGAGQTGGSVAVTGDSVRVKAGARIDASGSAGGGQVLLGGDFRGGIATTAEYEEYALRPARKPLPAAEKMSIEAGAAINADAVTSGRGGEVIAWSDAVTSVHGHLSARGGSQGGDGGFIETSGHWLDVAGIGASTQAARGRSGTWLLDPYELTVIGIGSTTANQSGLTPLTFSSTSGGSTVLASAITGPLNGGTSVKLQTSGSAPTDGDITVAAPIFWNTNTGATLTLDAYHSVLIDANITASGTNPGLSVLFNHGGSLHTAPGKSVTLPATASLYVNGLPYTVITLLGAQNSLTGTDLQGINGNLTNNYALGQDIDASQTSGWSWSPIGPYTGASAALTFSGNFDGLGHVVSGLTINGSVNYVGLFGVINSPGVVRNLGLSGGSVTNSLQATGMLVGNNFGTILNSYATGSVAGGMQTGGLAGENHGLIGSGSYATANVSAVASAINIGGLVGLNSGTIESGSFASGNISGANNTGNIGGLVGYNSSGTIGSGSYATGNVSATTGAAAIGGLVGDNTGTIGVGSYASGSVSAVGGNYFGGLVGYNNLGFISSGSYATGNVSVDTSSQFIGGLVGKSFSSSTIGSLSYATGNVSAGGASVSIGGLVGLSAGTIGSGSYATGSVTGGTNAHEIGGLVGENQGSIGAAVHYMVGTVSAGVGGYDIGGLVGRNSSGASVGLGSYATGNISGGNTANSIGGLIGYNLSGATIGTGSFATGDVSAGSNAAWIGGS